MDLACAILARAGYEPPRASSLLDCQRHAGSAAVPLMVADQVLPTFTGTDVATTLAATHPEMPVCLCGSNAATALGCGCAATTDQPASGLRGSYGETLLARPIGAPGPGPAQWRIEAPHSAAHVNPVLCCRLVPEDSHIRIHGVSLKHPPQPVCKVGWSNKRNAPVVVHVVVLCQLPEPI